MSDPSSAPTSPLAGLRIVDLTRVLAGPVCGRILADLGADVIKLEPPDGDLSREIAPKSDRGNSGLYTLANVGKRNVSIDLASTAPPTWCSRSTRTPTWCSRSSGPASPIAWASAPTRSRA